MSGINWYRGLSGSRTRRRALALLAVLALLVALLPAGSASATASSVDVTAGDEQAGAVTDYDVSFSVDEAVYAGDEIKVIFDSDFNLDNVDPSAIEVTVSDTVYSFYAEKAGPIITLTYTGADEIPANSDYTVTIPDVGNPTATGTYSVSVRAPAADSPVSGTVEIVAGPPAALSITGLSDEDPDTPGIQVTAGNVQNLTVKLLDEYGNEGASAPDEGITVTLTDNDPEPNFDGEEEGTVEIAAGSSEGNISWTPITAATVTISAEAEGLTPDSETLTVLAAAPSELVLTGPTDLNVGERGTYTVSLRDDYGNAAVAGDGGVPVSLASDPAGNFYAPPDATEPTGEVTIPPGQTSADFAFAGNEAALTTVRVSADSLTDEMQVAVGVTVLSSLGIEAPETAEVGIAVPVTISLIDQHGNPFVAPEGGVDVELETDNESSTFFNAPANGEVINTATVPAGQSSVTVYYVPDTNAVGAHTLSFVTNKILSNGDLVEDDGVQAETVINVGTGAELELVVSGLNFTAGQRGEITITVLDSHDNEVPAGPNGRVVYLETESPTGKFFTDAESDEPIDQVTIPAGEASVSVYYVDTESWTKKAMADGKLSATGLSAAGYSYTVAFRSEGVIGFQGAAIVDPAEAAEITLDVAQQDVDAVSDEDWTQIGSQIGAQDLIGIAKMRVGVVDQYGNPVPQSTLLRISVKDDSPSAFLSYDYAELDNDAWAVEEDAWLVVIEPGTYTVSASAGGFADVQTQVTFEEPALVIDAPATALPDTRVPVTVRLTNLWASGRDLTVDLGTGTENSAFYATDQTAEPTTTATIEAYTGSVTVYLESDDPLGTEVGLTAAIADLNLTAQATVTLGRGPDGIATLSRGWNIVSTPWVLADGKNTLDQIIAIPEGFTWNDFVEQAWGYKDGEWYPVVPTTLLRPLEAVFVKLKGQTEATFWAQRGLGTPPVRDLAADWNLVGNPAAEDKPANEALSSITGSYAVVISPKGFNQADWVYTPQTPEPGSYVMNQFRGYWVYMTKADRLAGQATPPLQ